MWVASPTQAFAVAEFWKELESKPIYFQYRPGSGKTLLNLLLIK